MGLRIAIVWGFAAFLSAVCPCCAQVGTAVANERSAVPAESRFEILHSTIAAKATYRIDKFTGAVDVLTIAADGAVGWAGIPREGNALSIELPNRPNYQMLVSGLALRWTLLINVNTGVTWQLNQSKEGLLHWVTLPPESTAGQTVSKH